MTYLDRQQHWENIYQTKALTEVSWYQATPKTALEFLATFKLKKTAKIIDIGGGDSFLTDKNEIIQYQTLVQQTLAPNGIILIGTFSTQGPKQCSGISIKQYSKTTLTNLFAPNFTAIECRTLQHQTPSRNIQNFVF